MLGTAPIVGLLLLRAFCIFIMKITQLLLSGVGSGIRLDFQMQQTCARGAADVDYD